MARRNPSATEHERIALEILRDALDKLVFNVAAWPSKYLDKFELAAHEAEYTDNAELKALTKKWRRMAKRSWGVKSGKEWRRSLPSDYDHVEELLEEAMHGKLPTIPVKANPAKRSRASRKNIVSAPPVHNFSAPKKKKSESWSEYHDRLTAMARDAKKRGDVAVANTLLVRAGEIARVRKRVREKPRGRGASGPGTYPWEQCIQDQLGRYGTMDRAKRVCGAIRARSQRAYPAYWKARDPGRALPGPRMNPESDLTWQVLAEPGGGYFWIVYGYNHYEREDAIYAKGKRKTEPDAEAAARSAISKLRNLSFEERVRKGLLPG